MRLLTLVAALVLCLASLAAARQVVDAAGRTVTVPDTVRRVICSGSGCLRLPTYLQGQDLAVAVDDIEVVTNSWNYNASDAGDETALGLGVRVERVCLSGMLVASALTAAIIASLGIIGFVGLVVLHMVRRLVGADHRFLLPASILGGALLLAADIGADVLNAIGFQVRPGELIAILGPNGVGKTTLLKCLNAMLASHGMGAVMTIHDLNKALRYRGTALMLKDGRIHSYGPTREVTAAMIEAVYGLPVAIHHIDGCPLVVALDGR